MSNEIIVAHDGELIAQHRIKLTPTGAEFADDLTFEEWSEFVGQLRAVTQGVQWWWGDALNFGERKYGEMYTQALEETDWERGTLKNLKWVAGKIERSCRHDLLSYEHHRILAAKHDLSIEEIDVLLAQAEENHWSKRELSKQADDYIRKRKEQELLEEGKIHELPDGVTLFVADIGDGLPEIPDKSIDVIVTDPPYPKEYLSLWEELAIVAERVLKPGGIVIVMTPHIWLPEIVDRMGLHLTYRWIVAYLEGGECSLQHGRRVLVGWKPLLIYSNGDISDQHTIYDVVETRSPASQKEYHEWGQSVDGMQDIIEKLTQEGDTILDPFLGAGATGVAAVRLKRKFVGSDIDERCVEISRARIATEVGDGVAR